MVDKKPDDTLPETPQPLPGEEPREETAEEPAAGAEDKLRTDLDEALNRADSFRDQLLRKAAEFENYKRRTEAEFAALIAGANEGLLLSLLPVIDDLDRSLAADKESRNPEAFVAGIEMIRTKFLKILERNGVTPFESIGKPFSVEYHDALLQVPRTDVDPHTVVQEVEPGYMVRDKVLRHAKVIVSTTPPPPEESHDQA